MSHHHEPSIDPRIIAAAEEGCPESRWLLSRRSLVGLSAGFFASSVIPRTALSAATDKRLLIVLLRGGMDGLHVALPVGDTAFLETRRVILRKTVTVPDPLRPNRTINVQMKDTLLTLTEPNGQEITDYKLHPALETVAEMFNTGHAAIVKSIAPPLRNRSHFQCQFNLESGYGQENPVASEGWLNRLLQTPELSALDRVTADPYKAIAGGPMPFILNGKAAVGSWQIDGYDSRYQFPNDAHAALLRYYDAHDRPNRRLLEGGLARLQAATAPSLGTNSLDDLTKLSDPQQANVRHLFRGAARMMRRSDGPRIGVVAIEGWDTHIAEAVASGLSARLKMLDNGLKDFKAELGDTMWNSTVVVCVSEFGRTIELNSSTADGCGTEHGRATVALLVGGGLNQGGFYGRLDTDTISAALNVNEGDQKPGRHDLEPTMDTRQLFARVLEGHMGIDRRTVDDIFPGFTRTAMLHNMFNDA